MDRPCRVNKVRLLCGKKKKLVNYLTAVDGLVFCDVTRIAIRSVYLETNTNIEVTDVLWCTLAQIVFGLCFCVHRSEL